MFAPVVNRLHVYKVAVTPGTLVYMDAWWRACVATARPGSSTNTKSPEPACAASRAVTWGRPLQADRATPALTLKMLAVAPRKHDL